MQVDRHAPVSDPTRDIANCHSSTTARRMGYAGRLVPGPRETARVRAVERKGTATLTTAQQVKGVLPPPCTMGHGRCGGQGRTRAAGTCWHLLCHWAPHAAGKARGGLRGSQAKRFFPGALCPLCMQGRHDAKLAEDGSVTVGTDVPDPTDSVLCNTHMPQMGRASPLDSLMG